MLYYVHSHHSVIVLIHVTWVTLVSLCMQCTTTCLMLWRASAYLSMSMSINAIYTNAKPCWCAIVHQTWNFARFSPWKWGNSNAVFLQWKLCENSVLCAMMHLRQSATKFSPRKQGEMLPNFHHGNLAPNLECTRKTSIRATHSKTKPQSPTR